jgi:hypothetical protein
MSPIATLAAEVEKATPASKLQYQEVITQAIDDKDAELQKINRLVLSLYLLKSRPCDMWC